MLAFPRWKYLLVLVVSLLGLVFALPNFFPQDPSLQIVRKDRVAIDATARQQIEDELRRDNVAFSGSFIDGERLVLRFAAVPAQLKARDVVNEKFAAEYSSALATAPRAPAWLRAVGLKPMSLGLDLRGGLNLLYQVDVDGAVTKLLDTYEQDFRRTLTAARIDAGEITRIKTDDSPINNTMVIALPAGANAEAARDALAAANTDLAFTVVKDAQGANTVQMTLTPAQIAARKTYAMQQNITTLRNRVNEMGVAESLVVQQGAERIDVQLPGIQNSAEVKDILGKVATLEFRLVDMTDNAFQAQASGRAPLGAKLYKDKAGTPVLLKRELIASGDQLTNAQSSIGTDGPEVNVTLDSRGGDSMMAVTRLNVGKLMAVVYIETSHQTTMVDGQKVEKDITTSTVINQATIQSLLTNKFRITGLQAGEASELALLMRAGALATSMYPVEERAIGPSLGQDNIDKGERALLAGMLIVFGFMAIYYRRFGWVANIVLISNVMLLVALMSMIRAALSLPGIAGIVLTVGMAVDANILIYERIREELRNNVSPQAAIRAGFDKAFSAISDANVTTLIAGVVLWVFGTGPIRGFAVVLVLGIATSLFTAIIGSRALVTLMYGGSRRVTKLSI
ncbi:MAG TPA: protein translocase subunit SecD [Steroidobacteraceae bacterium]|nr:protein translocase subunit SecD [Steroidobacteraceae bacterium]